ncbi:MAG: tRNA pseudouridine(13) synthase TruD [Deltaproteobacteria bacterium]|nr:MAG: tRNA pseudouridine(13) synthase TruD [Deltaproteobacteria bacterium]
MIPEQQLHWPGLLPPPTHGCLIKVEPEDFQVDEIPAYRPSGSGDHLLVLVEKRNHTTPRLARALARHLRLAEFDVGMAGLKDRRALTRQWLSLPASCAGQLDDFHMEGVRLLEVARHNNKLKTGHLKGNRFRILLRECPAGAVADIRTRAERLLASGVPNYFGPQRFGHEGSSLAEGLDILHGRRGARRGRELRLKLSAVQSKLFNDVLAGRIRQGILGRALAGDVMCFDGSRSLFTCTEPEADQPRVERLEIHPTGPLFGPRMMAAGGEVGRLEQQVAAESRVDLKLFERFRKLMRGGRRPLRLRLADFAMDSTPQGPVLTFTLPPGCYATVVLRELVDYREPSR